MNKFIFVLFLILFSFPAYAENWVSPPYEHSSFEGRYDLDSLKKVSDGQFEAVLRLIPKIGTDVPFKMTDLTYRFDCKNRLMRVIYERGTYNDGLREGVIEVPWIEVGNYNNGSWMFEKGCK